MFQSTFHISDAAMNVLFIFLSMFLVLLAKKVDSNALELFAAKLPHSVKSAKSQFTKSYEDFEKYSCCQNCSSIYKPNTSLVNDSRCSHVEFPNHPMTTFRQPCNTPLMKAVKSVSPHRTVYRPKLVYCYKSVTKYLQELIMRPGFIEKCELWRSYSKEPGKFKDIYDGEIWADFMEYEGKAFLSLPFNYALHLNVDWFQPFEHTQHSEGAVYLTVLNLPRKERYHPENVMG